MKVANGDGVALDKRLAAYYFNIAADHGREDGQFHYANLVGNVGRKNDDSKRPSKSPIGKDKIIPTRHGFLRCRW
jgi:TPR repeat protein